MFEWDIHARESTENRTYCWLKQQSRWTGKWMSVTTVNEYRRNMEKPGISVKVKLMTRWNVNGTVVIQDSVPVSHTWAKNNTGYWQRWNPRAVYNRDRSSSLWIIHFILFFSPILRKTHWEQSVMKGFLHGFVQCSMERPLSFLTLSYRHVSDRTSQSLIDNSACDAASSNHLPED